MLYSCYAEQLYDFMPIIIFPVGGLSIDFVNDSPSVQSNSVVAEFKITGSATKVVCCLIPKPQNGNKCVKCKLLLNTTQQVIIIL